jgi:hypothetical protein
MPIDITTWPTLHRARRQSLRDIAQRKTYTACNSELKISLISVKTFFRSTAVKNSENKKICCERRELGRERPLHNLTVKGPDKQLQTVITKLYQ